MVVAGYPNAVYFLPEAVCGCSVGFGAGEVGFTAVVCGLVADEVTREPAVTVTVAAAPVVGTAKIDDVSVPSVMGMSYGGGSSSAGETYSSVMLPCGSLPVTVAMAAFGFLG